MPLLVRAFPVTCDVAEVEAFADQLRSRSDETRRFYTGLGVRREAWFFQEMRAGGLVIGVTDIDGDVAQLGAEYARADDAFSSWFKSRVRDLSGIDPAEKPLGPPTEMVFDSSGADLPENIAISARIYPLRSREAVLEFAGELREREDDTRAFYEGFDVPREVWFLQETEEGPVVIGVTAMTKPERAAEYAASRDPFVSWFKQRVIDVTGVDPNRTPLGPPSAMVFDFQA